MILLRRMFWHKASDALYKRNDAAILTKPCGTSYVRQYVKSSSTEQRDIKVLRKG